MANFTAPFESARAILCPRDAIRSADFLPRIKSSLHFIPSTGVVSVMAGSYLNGLAVQPLRHSHCSGSFAAVTSADFSRIVATAKFFPVHEISMHKVYALSHHLPAAFAPTADSVILPRRRIRNGRNVCDFCPSSLRLACIFFQIAPCDGHPCCSAMCSLQSPWRTQGFRPSEHAVDDAYPTQKDGQIARLFLFPHLFRPKRYAIRQTPIAPLLFAFAGPTSARTIESCTGWPW